MGVAGSTPVDGIMLFLLRGFDQKLPFCHTSGIAQYTFTVVRDNVSRCIDFFWLFGQEHMSQ